MELVTSCPVDSRGGLVQEKLIKTISRTNSVEAGVDLRRGIRILNVVPIERSKV
jgi:hypothetical protein